MIKTWIRFEVSGGTHSEVFLVFVMSDKNGELLSTGSPWLHGGETKVCADYVKTYKDAGMSIEVVYYGGAEHNYDYLITQTDGE